MFTFGFDIVESNEEDIYRCLEYPRNSIIIVKHSDEEEECENKNMEIDVGGFFDNYVFNTILRNHRLNL